MEFFTSHTFNQLPPVPLGMMPPRSCSYIAMLVSVSILTLFSLSPERTKKTNFNPWRFTARMVFSGLGKTNPSAFMYIHSPMFPASTPNDRSSGMVVPASV